MMMISLLDLLGLALPESRSHNVLVSKLEDPLAVFEPDREHAGPSLHGLDGLDLERLKQRFVNGQATILVCLGL